MGKKQAWRTEAFTHVRSLSLSPSHTHPEIAFLRTSITPVCRGSSLVSSGCKCPLRWWTAWRWSEDAQLQQSSFIYVGKQEWMKRTASTDWGLKTEHPPLHKLIHSLNSLIGQITVSDNSIWSLLHLHLFRSHCCVIQRSCVHGSVIRVSRFRHAYKTFTHVSEC